MKKKIFLFLWFIFLFATGCGYNSEYACKGYPEGAKCLSVSEVYRNSINGGSDNRLAEKEKTKKGGKEEAQIGLLSEHKNSLEAQLQKEDGMPIRRPPNIWRMQIFPWHDEDDDLHQGEMVYIVIDKGAWVIGGESVVDGRETLVYPTAPPLLPVQNNKSVQQNTVNDPAHKGRGL